MIKHFLYVPFTGLGLHGGYRGDKWLRNRIKVFYRFVLPSIMNQSNQNFTVWFSWREEDRKNPIVQQFKQTLEGVRDFNFIFTYGGVCFYDDKYPPLEAKDRLLKSLQANLPDLKDLVGEAEWVYMTIQPSDDIYLSGAVEAIQAVPPFESMAIGYKDGYIMNYATKEIAEYNPDTLPPFYTIVFPSSVFLNPFEHIRYIGPYVSHEYVKDKFKLRTFVARGFVVGTHGSNISTIFNHPYKGRTLTNEEHDTVLIKTGTLFSEPIVSRNRLRLVARNILNLMPLQDRLRKAYHKLPEKIKIL